MDASSGDLAASHIHPTEVPTDFLVERRGFEPLTSAVEAPARSPKGEAPGSDNDRPPPTKRKYQEMASVESRWSRVAE